jgi:cyclopropane fatty-acyl-phospholipid synthase-like methyltransferase
LEFGGGIGDICQIIYLKCNKNVTYLDIESYLVEFAKWRFAKYSLPIEVKITPQDKLIVDGEYDIIYQDAVLAHLNHDQQVLYTKKLCEHLAPGGLMIIITDMGREPDVVPPKYPVQLDKVHEALVTSGLRCLSGYNEFASVWKRDAQTDDKEFKKFGIAAIDYTDADTARGFTYTTLQNEFPPTPILSPINPFNDDIITAKNVLEIGCGVGRNLPYIMEKTNAHYWGIDPNKEMLQYFWDVSDHKYKDRVTLVHDWSELPAELRFDFVLSTFVFQHIAFMAPEGVMNVSDITRQAMKFTRPGTVWFVLEHEREQAGWQERWMKECKIIPEVYYRPGGNHAGGGTIPYPEFVSMTHRGNDNNIIIFKEKK